ncbi:Rrf2 family transcriptional regulator [Kamptonema cortianum]|nr:Rrf2 family transcriptional regulator [Geitlerinema splendidum]MDK3162486.1 Rrf2 family transcriptional regulator [Kamptonema cortianum]
MKFSAQEEYGLRCLIALARTGEDGSLTIPEISKMEGMTASHVAKILAILRKAKFVKSTRGQLGGYSLATSPDRIVVRDVLVPLGGKIFDNEFCDKHTGVLDTCVHDTDCILRPLWGSIQTAVDSVVGKYTLADLMEGRVESPKLGLTQPPTRVPVRS